MVIRKTSHKIREDILAHLKKGPLSTKKLGEILKSNWSTINNYLEELKQIGEVREIYARENLRVYVRSDYPVFYGLPLEKSKFNDCLYLLAKIVEEWKNKNNGQIISKTTLQKVAVEIIKKNSSFNLPVVRFHYGKMLPLSFEPSNFQEILKEYNLKNPVNFIEMDKAVKKEIKDGDHSNIAWVERKRQYGNTDMKVFQIKEEISGLFYQKKADENLQNMFYNLFMEIPTTERYSYLFKKYHDFITSVSFIFSTEEFNKSEEDKKKFLLDILNTFNVLWQTLTTEFFFEDFEQLIDKDFEEIKDFIKDSKINTYSSESDEKLKDISEYKKSLTFKKEKLSEDEKRIMEILLEGADEE